MLRAGGAEFALRAAEGAMTARGAVTPVGVETWGTVRPFSTRTSPAPTEAVEGVEEFVFTKRCS
jgi:hypothetical protein